MYDAVETVETEPKQLTPETCPFEPLEDFLIVRRDVQSETKGGIALPASVQQGKGRFGARATVLAIGPGRMLEDGKIAPMAVAVNDVILFSAHAGIELEEEVRNEMDLDRDEADKVIMLRSVDVVCKVKK
jgi:chaperonin GroES